MDDYAFAVKEAKTALGAESINLAEAACAQGYATLAIAYQLERIADALDEQNRAARLARGLDR